MFDSIHDPSSTRRSPQAQRPKRRSTFECDASKRSRPPRATKWWDDSRVGWDWLFGWLVGIIHNQRCLVGILNQLVAARWNWYIHRLLEMHPEKTSAASVNQQDVAGSSPQNLATLLSWSIIKGSNSQNDGKLPKRPAALNNKSVPVSQERHSLKAWKGDEEVPGDACFVNFGMAWWRFVEKVGDIPDYNHIKH